MTSNAIKHIPYENIPKGSSSFGYVTKLVNFFETYLPDLTKDRVVSGSQNENDLTEVLYNHLCRKRKFNSEGIEYPFEFQTEKSQKKQGAKGHAKRADIAVRINTIDCDMEVVYILEAKKLPTGKGKREQEYVKGKGGGIQRFKDDAHGLDDLGGLLPHNGIIAYVTENEYAYWYEKINLWIRDCGWNESECLQLKSFNKIGQLTSNHPRTLGTNVMLDHFWIKIE